MILKDNAAKFYMHGNIFHHNLTTKADCCSQPSKNIGILRCLAIRAGYCSAHFPATPSIDSGGGE